MFVARNHKGLLCNALEEKIEKELISSARLVQGQSVLKGKVMQPHFAYFARRVSFL